LNKKVKIGRNCFQGCPFRFSALIYFLE
jgi:hypothetical protein